MASMGRYGVWMVIPESGSSITRSPGRGARSPSFLGLCDPGLCAPFRPRPCEEDLVCSDSARAGCKWGGTSFERGAGAALEEGMPRPRGPRGTREPPTRGEINAPDFKREATPAGEPASPVFEPDAPGKGEGPPSARLEYERALLRTGNLFGASVAMIGGQIVTALPNAAQG